MRHKNYFANLFLLVVLFLFLSSTASFGFQEGTWITDNTGTIQYPVGGNPLLLGSWIRTNPAGTPGSNNVAGSDGYIFSSDSGNQWEISNLVCDFGYSINNSYTNGYYYNTNREEWSGGTLTVPDWFSSPINNYSGKVTYTTKATNPYNFTVEDISWHTTHYYEDTSDTYRIDWNFEFDENPSLRVINPDNTRIYHGNVTQIQVDSVIDNDMDGAADANEWGPTGTNPNYDGNGDGTPDAQQRDVTSVTTENNQYITLEAVTNVEGETITLGNVTAHSAAEPDALLMNALDNPSFPDMLVSDFQLGFYEFEVEADLNNEAIVKFFLPEEYNPDSYWKFGPTAPGANAEWYEFMRVGDSGTGAVINGNEVTLYFIDGQLGDDDFLSNGTIYDIGAPSFSAETVPVPAAAWLLGSGLIGLVGIRRRINK